MFEYAHNAINNNIEVIIAGAGGAAYLPGMVAAMTTLPVIGVPVQSKALNGIDSLLSIVQMPHGVPVATVSINGARNAALISVRILSIKYPKTREICMIPMCRMIWWILLEISRIFLQILLTMHRIFMTMCLKIHMLYH